MKSKTSKSLFHGHGPLTLMQSAACFLVAHMDTIENAQRQMQGHAEGG